MVMQFNTFKESWLNTMLEQLWSQWVELGVAGYAGKQTGLKSFIDPEALILTTCTFGRWDARLFDEMLSWLLMHAGTVNVKRLASLMKLYPQSNVLHAIAFKVAQKHGSWARLQKEQEGKEKLFYLSPTTHIPLPTDVDADFERTGLLRAPFVDRKMASRFDPQRGPSLVLKLRSLLGMNAHADVLAYYADGRKAHASLAARDLAYSQRTVQEILSQMELGGGVKVYSEGRKKLFQIDHSCWGDLLPKGFSWKNLARSGAHQCQLWSMLFDANPSSPLMLASLLRRVEEAVNQNFPEFTDSSLSRYKGEEYTQQWYNWIDQLITDNA